MFGDDWREEIARAEREVDFRRLNRPVIDEAIERRRHQVAFHTADIAGDRRVVSAHRGAGSEPAFALLVSRYLRESTLRLGLRGPMPGDPHLGERWSFRADGAE